MQYLGLTPGSVTILAVLNDPDHRVEVIVDEDLWQCQSMQCHPLVNTSTLIMAVDDIRRFLAITGHEARVMRIPVRR